MQRCLWGVTVLVFVPLGTSLVSMVARPRCCEFQVEVEAQENTPELKEIQE